jgi:hypothetical protein
MPIRRSESRAFPNLQTGALLLRLTLLRLIADS